MIIENDIKLDFDDVLLVPQRSTLESRKQVGLLRTFQFYHSPRELACLPIMASNMVQTGCFTMAKALAKDYMLCALHKYYTSEELRTFYKKFGGCEELTFVSIGMKEEEIDRIATIEHCPNIVIDVANGHIEKFTKFCAKVRDIFPQSIIMAGNVCIPEMTQELIVHGGVDIVKLNIGPGKNCKTRKVTGVGYPSFSATVNCAQVAHGLKNGERKLGLVCTDGGFREVGDLSKAFGAGADFCMTSSLFAGVDECEGNWKLLGGEKYIHNEIICWGREEGSFFSSRRHDDNINDNSHYSEIITHKLELANTWKKPPQKLSLQMYGMSSHLAQDIHGEGKKEYRASEGIVDEVKYKGKLEDTLQEITGGLRSTATYIGATCLKDFGKCSKFIKVNRIHTDDI